ncbi:MAG: inorganic phosphate transporter [Acidobacteriota bacterium]
MIWVLFIAAISLAYANGANDNFKGVATLLGSRTIDYRRALAWACWTTLAGSISAFWVARGLLQAFSGKGLVPDSIVASSTFQFSVGLGAAATVLLATRFGLPISTTHALIGSLLGAGLIHAGGSINVAHLISIFLLPLFLSPLVAVISVSLVYLTCRWARLAAGIDKDTCICVGQEVVETIPVSSSGETLLRPLPILQATINTDQVCRQVYRGTFFGFSAARGLDILHYVSAGTVGFARGLNDTPKIAALLLMVTGFPSAGKYGVVAFFMALGGWISARRVAETMSHKITALNPGQGFSANLTTAFLIIVASRLGLPVSTTHVSSGSLFGIGLLSANANLKVITSILFSWVGTLPVAILIAALLSLMIR